MEDDPRGKNVQRKAKQKQLDNCNFLFIAQFRRVWFTFVFARAVDLVMLYGGVQSTIPISQNQTQTHADMECMWVSDYTFVANLF